MSMEQSKHYYHEMATTYLMYFIKPILSEKRSDVCMINIMERISVNRLGCIVNIFVICFWYDKRHVSSI